MSLLKTAFFAVGGACIAALSTSAQAESFGITFRDGDGCYARSHASCGYGSYGYTPTRSRVVRVYRRVPTRVYRRTCEPRTIVHRDRVVRHHRTTKSYIKRSRCDDSRRVYYRSHPRVHHSRRVYYRSQPRVHHSRRVYQHSSCSPRHHRRVRIHR